MRRVMKLEEPWRERMLDHLQEHVKFDKIVSINSGARQLFKHNIRSRNHNEKD